ncbi:MAG: ferritin family protein [Candidatus Eisenbacteria sp.]|nr:ferritin family protein [Candidatus Eisenbacteria bacterium]
MPEHNTDRERVEFALRTEQDGHEFYQMACQKVTDRLARTAFRLLGREELRHAELIEGLGQQLGGEGEAPTIETVTRKTLESDLKTIYASAQEGRIEDEMDPAAAYEKAIELEKQTTSLYAEYAGECDDDGAKRLFAVLLKEEEHHLSMLEDMYAYLTKPEEWFIDRDGIILDGG